MDALKIMDALKVAETTKQTLYSMTSVIAAGYLLICAFLRYNVLSGDGVPSRVGDSVPSGDSSLSGLPVGDALFLLAIPAGLALLTWAASLWERNLREKKQAREKEHLRKALKRFSPGGPSRGGPERESSPESSSLESSSPEGRSPPPPSLPLPPSPPSSPGALRAPVDLP
jgi:hypothetical protein